MDTDTTRQQEAALAMERVQETIASIIKGLKPKEPDPEILVNAELQRKGVPRFNTLPIKTPKAITKEVCAWLAQINLDIDAAEISTIRNHCAWLFELVHKLIGEREQVEQEAKQWKSIADGMLVEWMKATMGLKGEPLGRKAVFTGADGGAPDIATRIQL